MTLKTHAIAVDAQPANLAVELASALGELLLEKSLDITTAESCTGGLVAAAITEVAGSSGWFKQGVVTYSNEAKTALLSVPQALLEEHGAVSEACVLAMVAGACAVSGARLGISVSGIAGPGGGSAHKPVGTVWIAWAVGEQASAECYVLLGSRSQVREQAVICALRGIIERLKQPENDLP